MPILVSNLQRLAEQIGLTIPYHKTQGQMAKLSVTFDVVGNNLDRDAQPSIIMWHPQVSQMRACVVIMMTSIGTM